MTSRTWSLTDRWLVKVTPSTFIAVMILQWRSDVFRCIVLIPMYAGLYILRSGGVCKQYMYYTVYINARYCYHRNSHQHQAGTDCNESPTTPLGHGTLTGHCLGRIDQGRGSRTTFQVTISARLVSPLIMAYITPNSGDQINARMPVCCSSCYTKLLPFLFDFSKFNSSL